MVNENYTFGHAACVCIERQVTNSVMQWANYYNLSVRIRKGQ